MVIIRLARMGAKKQPYYQLTVADRRAPRDGRFIERVGFFNPLARGGAQRLRVDLERVDHWLSVGAKPSKRAASLIAEARRNPEAAAAPAERAEVGDAPGEAADADGERETTEA